MGHVHADESGVLVRCYHKCRTQILSFGFWLGVTISFPLEHLIWEKTPLSAVMKWLGL